MQVIFGIKQGQSQVFLEDGTRVPVTVVSVPETTVTQLKDEKEGYKAVQVGLGETKKKKKSALGHFKKANLEGSVRYVREVRLAADGDVSAYNLGGKIVLEEVLKPGDLVSAMGVSKGKGFAGGVKRHGFHGGPKTHGQSDRHRAPGSIGQGTTPGRVYKGKRMAGRMGQDQVTVKNLFIVDIQGSDVFVSGLIPGSRNTLIKIEKIGEKKNFVPVFNANKKEDEAVEEVSEPVETKEADVEQKAEEAVAAESAQPAEAVEEKVEAAPEAPVEQAAAPAEENENKEEEKVNETK